MRIKPRWIAVVWTIASTFAWSCPASAQEADAAMFYSQGVHAYFAGQRAQAEQYLSAALAIDPRDPRPYYFRALSRLRLGRTDEARRDMQAGAAWEAQAPNRFAVGAALERVQGQHRILLEQYRREGRLAEATRRHERNRARYQQISGREPEVLHQKIMIPLDQLLRPGGALPIVVVEASEPPRPAAATAAATATATVDATRPPVAGGSAPVTTMPSNPFGDDALPPTRTGAATSPTATGAAPTQPVVPENPFGDLFKTETSSDSTTPPASEASDEKPDADGPADNPFPGP